MTESTIVFFQSLISLLAILDPFGSVPMFSSLTSKLRKKERIKLKRKSKKRKDNCMLMKIK